MKVRPGIASAASSALAVLALIVSPASQESTDPHLQFDLATTLSQKGQHLEAMQAFDRAMRSDDAALALRARKGKVRAALRIAEFETARRDAETLGSGAAADADSLALYGDSLWATGLFDEAEAAYDAAAAADARSSRARHGVARSLATHGRLNEALEHALAAIALSPGDPELHALAGVVYERLNRFADAADEYDAYAALLAPLDATAIATARTRATFLRSFQGRVPRIAGRAGPYTTPFKLIRNKVVIQGRINGTRVDWVLDTGAERTGISSETALRAGIRPIGTTLTAGVGVARLRRVSLARAETVEVGRLRLQNVPVSVRDPAVGGAPRWQGESLSPLPLGLSVIVDYRRREVTLAPSLPEDSSGVRQAQGDPSSSRGDIRLPLRLHRVPLVRGLLNSRYPASFVVDTGGEVISISSETAESLGMTPSRRIPIRVFGLSGPDQNAFLLPGVDLDFDEIEYRKVGLAVLNLRAPSILLGFQVGGIVGHKFLGNYRVSMDLVRSELRLEKF